MIPFPCKTKLLSSLEHGIPAPKMPVLIRPREMIRSTQPRLELRDRGPPLLQQIRLDPEVEERFPAHRGKLCLNSYPIGRCSCLFEQRFVESRREQSSRSNPQVSWRNY